MTASRDQAASWQNRLGPRAQERVALEEYRSRSRAYRSYYWLTRRFLHRCIRVCIHLSGLQALGRRNLNSIEVVNHEVVLPRLSRTFDGFRILQLTDLHLDLLPGYEETIIDTLNRLSWDLAVITGDYRNSNLGSFLPAMDAIRPIVDVLLDRSQLQGIPPLATLGNHDEGAMVEALEAMGLRVLLNESLSIESEGQRLWIAGIDDSADFQSYDIPRALEQVREGDPVVLLSHAPDVYSEAADAGVDYMVSGHTHGGQICLPGGLALMTRTRAPRKCASGAWREGEMQGYTSRGTGACGVPCRFNCPPEITIHTLRSQGLQ
jgi:predicted MPP superfamily phosphohydrolase